MTQQVENGAPPQVAAPNKITYEEFLNRTDENTHVEWVDGEVVDMAPIADEHMWVDMFLARVLGEYVERQNLGAVCREPYQMKAAPHLPGRAPDLMFVSNANRRRLKKTHVEGPADLVIEIVSPESRARDRGEKFYEYQEGGVREYWIIDPERKQAFFYLLGDDRIYRPADIARDGIFRSTVLDGLWIRIAWLWQRPLPTLQSVLKEWGEA
jgi:Uma2 family endonuclease